MDKALLLVKQQGYSCSFTSRVILHASVSNDPQYIQRTQKRNRDEFDALCHRETMLHKKYADFTSRLKAIHNLIFHSLRVGTPSGSTQQKNMVLKPQPVHLNHLHPMKILRNALTIGDWYVLKSRWIKSWWKPRRSRYE